MSNPKRGFELCFYIFTCILLNISYSASLSSDPKAQQQLDEVLELPGQMFNVSFAHYSGYITVSEESGRALFYWFTEAVDDPSSKPLVLWLNGVFENNPPNRFSVSKSRKLFLKAKANSEHSLMDIRRSVCIYVYMGMCVCVYVYDLLFLFFIFMHVYVRSPYTWVSANASKWVLFKRGAGCSSIAYGMAEEIGPFHIEKDGKTLYLNHILGIKCNNRILFSLLQTPPPKKKKLTLNLVCSVAKKVANVLFLDSPVGVGFSYSNTSSDLLKNGDKGLVFIFCTMFLHCENTIIAMPLSIDSLLWPPASDSLAFLKKWLRRFPQYKGRDLYIVGESYAGHYIPQLSKAIVDYNSGKNSANRINIKGYMVGNALTDDYHDHVGVFEFMWSAGMISDQTYKNLNLLCDLQPFIHSSEQCDKTLEIAYEELGNIDPYSIYSFMHCQSWPIKSEKEEMAFYGTSLSIEMYENWCLRVVQSALSLKVFKLRCHHFREENSSEKCLVGHIGRTYDPCTEKHSVVYFNQPEVQKALHVRLDKAPCKWETCSDVVNLNWKDSPTSVLDIYRELIPSGLRIWVFSGDTDAVIPVTSTRYSINALNLPSVSPWRAWYDDGQVGGWTQEYEGLTFVTIRGAGHEVPLHRPKQALTLLKSFLSGNSMPAFEQVSDS
ncbi:Carboxypeptidase D [Bertholletia excelsa]